jgi:NHL repeat
LPGASARFSSPQFIAVESEDSLLVGDSANNRIFRNVCERSEVEVLNRF